MRHALTRIWAIAVKEVRQLRRDRLTFGMIVGIPLLQMLLFGYAINLDVRNLKAGVVDNANTQQSRNLVQDAQASQVIRVVAYGATPEALEDLLRRGDIDVGLVIPYDFEQRVIDGREAAQLLINGSDPTLEGIARQLARMPVGHRTGSSQQESIKKGVNEFATRTYYNPERRSPIFIVPALIGVILNLTMVLFTAIAIVRERERGNLELLITTPLRTAELMIGKLIPYILIGLVQVTLILALGIGLFHVPVRGSLFDLYAAALVFIAATLALGLVISTFAQTQFQSMQLTVFTFLPSILLSGFMFPFEGMPKIAQLIAEVLPLTHFVRLVRGIVLRGAELAEMLTPISALLAFFAVMMLIAVARFRKRLG